MLNVTHIEEARWHGQTRTTHFAQQRKPKICLRGPVLSKFNVAEWRYSQSAPFTEPRTPRGSVAGILPV